MESDLPGNADTPLSSELLAVRVAQERQVRKFRSSYILYGSYPLLHGKDSKRFGHESGLSGYWDEPAVG